MIKIQNLKICIIKLVTQTRSNERFSQFTVPTHESVNFYEYISYLDIHGYIFPLSFHSLSLI